jgi:hypothetical protein
VPSELGFMAGSQPPFSQLKGPFHNKVAATPQGTADALMACQPAGSVKTA